MARCDMEDCPMWDGDGCPCTTFGLDPGNLPTSGTLVVEWPAPLDDEEGSDHDAP